MGKTALAQFVVQLTEGRAAEAHQFFDDAKKPPTSIYQELTTATPKADALAVFGDLQGLLVRSEVLGMSVWVVRSPLDGIALCKETGHPALLLDDVLRLKGHTPDEARTALLPVLITLEQ